MSKTKNLAERLKKYILQDGDYEGEFAHDLAAAVEFLEDIASQEPVAYTSTGALRNLKNLGTNEMWWPFDEDFAEQAKEAEKKSGFVTKQVALYAAPVTKKHISRSEIKQILLDHGFTIKEGLDDLKPYVYDAVEAVLRYVSVKEKFSDADIDAASKAYAEHRNPEIWDGNPWGEVGRTNHRKAIKAAIEAAHGIGVKK